MKNIFNESRKVASVKKVVKNEVVDISGEYEKDINRIIEIDAEIESLKLEREKIDLGIREQAKKVMVDLYIEKNKFPGTLKVISGKRWFLFITCDKYIDIDKERAEFLSGKYGEGIVSERTVYTINPIMIEKYGDILSKMIMKSRKISKEDKKDIIKSSIRWSVAKGTVRRLRSALYIKYKLSMVLDDIRPIFQVKINRKPT